MKGQTARSRAYHEGPLADAPHFLYRCYDADGDLIYIGCTVDVKKRIAAHRRGGKNAASRWLAVCMTRYEVEGPFPGRDAGRAAEREAIQLEQPLFNYQQRAGLDLAAWMTRAPIAQYLVERGYVDLAVETACTCWPEDREAGTAAPSCAAHIAAGLSVTNLDMAS